MRKQTLTDFLLRVVTWVEFTDFQHHFSLISLQLILTDYFLNKYSVSDINLCLLIKLWGFFVGYFHQTTRGSEEEEDGKMSAGTSEFFCLICLLVCSCTALTNIKAEPGQDVILPCKAPDNKITAAEWRRPGLDPDYVLLYRGGRFDPDNQHPSYQNRVDLQDKEMKDGDFYLILKNVTMEDTGRFECHVDQSGKAELISRIILVVVEPDHSRTRVGLVVGLLVCLLLAAAVFLYRQYRKRKTLENEKPEELEHLERNHSETKNQLEEEKQENETLKNQLQKEKQENETLKNQLQKEKQKIETLKNQLQEEKQKIETLKNQLQKEKQKIETLNSHLKEWMKMRRNLQNSIQNMNKELNEVNFGTISNFTGSDEENPQEELEKQKWMKTVVNLKKELRNMDQELDKVISDPTGSFKENPQEEDENQKWMETVVNQKTELQNMNKKLELEESIAVADVHERGDVICPQNTSSEVGGCKLQLQKNYREPVIYTFKE